MELYVSRRGRGEPLLLVQGMSGTHASWGDAFLAELDDGFDCIAYDHRGIGRSPATRDPFTIGDLAEDAVALLDRLELETAHVLGISMGGMVAQELALRYGERIRTLTLGCTYAGGPGSALTAPADAQVLAEAMQSGDVERALRAGYEINLSEAFRADERHYAAFREMALAERARLPVIMLQMQAIGGHDTQARLGEIDRPTLVVHGTEDRMLPVANAQLIADRIPGARLELLDGVGHMFWWERPRESAALIRAHAGVGAAA